jgi:hypothetical protein
MAMENTPHLYDTLVYVLSQHPKWLDRRHLQTLAWMMVGLMQSGWISLTAWAPYAVGRARYAQSTVRRFRRWLGNDKIDVLSLYGPLMQQALGEWGEQALFVALDTSMLWDTYCLIRLSVIYRGRAVPLVWCVLKHGSAQVSHDTYKDLLDRAALLLPRSCKVVFLADRGFCRYRTDGPSTPAGVALAYSHQDQLLALAPRAAALQGLAYRGGAGARLFLAASFHHRKALWTGVFGRGSTLARQR